MMPSIEYRKIDRPVVGVAFDPPSGSSTPVHRHDRAQLVYASTGVMTITTTDGTWVVPPQRAVWVPAGLDHQIRMIGVVAMRTLYLQPGALADAPDVCRVVTVSPLLRELILRTVDMPQPYAYGGPEERLVRLLLDEIQTLDEEAPLHLPMPGDARLRVMANAMLDDPAHVRTLEQWAREAGMSARTLARAFVRETGVTFGVWRQQARLTRALELLAGGSSVTRVALEVGYNGPSAFSAMFRRALGRTPSRYFHTAREL